MKAYVTGGAGFIGSHLCEQLLDRGYQVVAIDDLSTGSWENIKPLLLRPNFVFLNGTVTDWVLSLENADVIFHLAAAVGVRLIVESPVRTIETNVRETEIVLGVAAKRGTKVLITSTSEVYGKSKKFPYSEEDDLVIGEPNKGRWSYAASKLLDEFLALAYFHEKRLPAVVVRLFNTIGPRQTGQYGMVVPTFIRQAKANEPITVYGDGSQSRCFGWVGDVVKALVDLVEEPMSQGRVYNIGGTEEITIGGLAILVKGLLGSSSDIVTVPYNEAYAPGFEDMQRRVPDLSRIKEEIWYEPTKTLIEMIRAIAEVK